MRGATPSSAAGSDSRRMEANRAALADHISTEGWEDRSYSDVEVAAYGRKYQLHRLILARSPYFNRLLGGPWREAAASSVTLQVDDVNVDTEAVNAALAYLYGHPPQLHTDNACQTLAAASYLDLQDLCTLCTDFIISDLWNGNLLKYQAFSEGYDYGSHGECVKAACWGYMCTGGAVELKDLLPRLSLPTLRALLMSDELWVPNEAKRLELALWALSTRAIMAASEQAKAEAETDIRKAAKSTTDDNFVNTSGVCSKTSEQSHWLEELLDDIISTNATSKPDRGRSEADKDDVETPLGGSSLRRSRSGPETAQAEASAYSCLVQEQSTDGGRGSLENPDEHASRMFPRSWGTGSTSSSDFVSKADTEERVLACDIADNGGISYCHLAFPELVAVRNVLEAEGLPDKAANEGLWLQTLLRTRVLAIAADTCNSCSHLSASCTCKKAQPVGPFCYDRSHLATTSGGSTHHPSDPLISSVPPSPTAASRAMRATGASSAGLGGVFAFGSEAGAGIARMGLVTMPIGSPPSAPQTPRKSSSSVHRQSTDGPARFPCRRVTGAVTEETASSEGEILELQGWKGEGSSREEVSGEEKCVRWDLNTPLRSFPPCRFGVEFGGVERLSDGQSRQSPETFYAGSMWKVSVQAFSQEDAQGRRTLGLFLHRRKADDYGSSSQQVSWFVDSREKVTACYQLVCPSRKGIMALGNLHQTGTLLPRAPKGWGWRTAFLFDELQSMLQGGALRVAAIVQLV